MKYSVVAIIVIVCVFVFEVQNAHCANWYVRVDGNDTACNGTANASSASAPNCAEQTIVAGVAHLTGIGDVLNIAAGTYNETTGSVLPASGASGNRIRIVGAGASTTIWQHTGSAVTAYGGAIQGTNRSYIEITGIKFKDIKTKTIIDHQGSSATATDWWIHDNIFEGNGTQGTHPCAKTGAISGRCDGDGYSRIINFRGTVALDGTALNVSNNVFDGNYGANIQGDIGNSTFNNNTVTNQHSSKADSFNGWQYFFRWLIQFGGCTGCGNNTISGNDMGVTEKDSYVVLSDCGPDKITPCKWVGAAIKGDTGASNNLVSNNIIHDSNVSNASNTNLDTIFWEATCNSNNNVNNVIYNIGGSAIKLGSVNQANAANNIVDGNSIYNCECGVALIRATTTIVKNNIDHRGTFNANGAFIIRTDLSVGPHVFKNNLIYDSSPTTTNYSGTSTNVSACSAANVTYASWQATYGETNSIGPSSDPQFLDTTTPGFDFHLTTPGSPALDAGDSGQDMGAYPLSNPPPTSTISLSFPNGGNDLISGDVANINWTTTQTGNCKVELARDGSNFSEVLSASTTCTAQTYAWTVTPPGRVSTAKIKVSSLSAPTVVGQSDAAFNIRGKYVSVLP